MKRQIYVFALLALICAGCTKDYLEKRRDAALLVPTSLEDFQKLLDANFNSNMNTVTGLNEIASDNFVADDATLSSLDPQERNSYLWKQDIFEGAPANDWNYPYQAIFTCNVVLDGLRQKPSPETQAAQLEGTALFYRANAFLSLANEFASPYDPKTAVSVAGIPIRITSDVNIITGRGTLKETFDRITTDLKQAAQELPETVSFKNRPTKAAALALLARTYLIMQDYDQALTFATAALSKSGKLIDYNALSPTGFDSPFPLILPNGNEEALVFENLVGYSFFVEPGVFVDQQLYDSYENNDLRKSAYFADQGNGGYNYIGSYSGDFSTLFGGPAVDELYLIRAECNARQNKVAEALKDLNDLLVTRWVAGTYVNRIAANATEALKLILKERRKELIGRGLRWIDLRRLNQDDQFKETLTKVSNGNTITLAPGDKKYTFPIPDEEISRSRIPQNER